MQQASLDIFGVAVPAWGIIPAFYLTWVVIVWTLKKAVFAWLRTLSARTSTKIDDILIDAASWPVSIMIFVWGLTATLHFTGAALPARWAAYTLTAAKVATLAATVMFIDRVAISGFRLSSARFEVLKTSQAFGAVLIHAVVFFVGGLMLLDSFGVSIAPLLASLGIGSLALALALQPTLENVFSGFQLIVDQPIKVGHFVRLESGEDGFVHQIGWRSTWIRQGLNNMIIIPNKQLVNARVLNYDYPSPELLFVINMGVHYGSDLAVVERVAVEVGTDIMKRVPGAVPDWTPVIRYTQFGASSIDFVVVLKARSFGDRGLVIHEFVKAVTARFAREKIVIPYPVVAVDTGQQAAQLAVPGSDDRATKSFG